MHGNYRSKSIKKKNNDNRANLPCQNTKIMSQDLFVIYVRFTCYQFYIVSNSALRMRLWELT